MRSQIAAKPTVFAKINGIPLLVALMDTGANLGYLSKKAMAKLFKRFGNDWVDKCYTALTTKEKNMHNIVDVNRNKLNIRGRMNLNVQLGRVKTDLAFYYFLECTEEMIIGLEYLERLDQVLGDKTQPGSFYILQRKTGEPIPSIFQINVEDGETPKNITKEQWDKEFPELQKMTPSDLQRLE